MLDDGGVVGAAGGTVRWCAGMELPRCGGLGMGTSAVAEDRSGAALLVADHQLALRAFEVKGAVIQLCSRMAFMVL